MASYKTTRIYRSTRDVLRELPPEQYKMAMEAYFDYAFDEELPKVSDPMVDMFIKMHVPLIDKYHKQVVTNQKNGKKGGRPPSYDAAAYKEKAKSVPEYKKKDLS